MRIKNITKGCIFSSVGKIEIDECADVSEEDGQALIGANQATKEVVKKPAKKVDE